MNKRAFSWSLVLSVVVFASEIARADGVRLTNDPAPSSDPYVCSVGDGTGNLSIVWVDARLGTDRVYFTRYNPTTGTKVLGDISVSSGAAAASLPSCGVDSAGATHIVWLQAGGVTYAKLSSTGTVLVAPFVRVAAPADQPHVDVEPGGNGHLVWVDTTSPRKVKYRKLNSSGGDLAGCSERIYDTADTVNTAEHPFILAPGSGNNVAFVSWHGDTTTFEHLVDVALPFPGCNDLNGPFQQTNDIAAGRTAMTENLTSENAWLVFEGHTESPLQHVYWLAGAGNYMQVDLGIGPASQPAIAAISDSQVFTVWEDGRYGRPWIFGQAVNGATSSFVGTNCLISDGRASARNPSMTRATSGTFGIVWDDDRHGAREIYIALNGPTCAGFDAVDPNPSLVSAGSIVTSPATLAGTEARSISGLAADGVTPVLLRYKVPSAGTVTFDLFDELGGSVDVGHLRRPAGNENAVTLAVPTDNVAGSFWAFALLIAPDRFHRAASDDALAARSVRVRATFQPTVGPPTIVERTLDIKRPPVLLLHGLWGKASSWGWPLMTDPRFTVYAHDYWQTNAAPIATNLREARRGVAGAVEKARDSGIAATQADAYGHSMGGLLLRKHRASEFYFSDASLKAGDLHSLVTVDTPHAGSGWADFLLAAPPLHPLLMNLGMCASCGAVNDLRPDSSEITSLPETLVPAHAFVGKGGSDLIQAGQSNAAPRELRAFLLVARLFDILPQDVFANGLEHDFIVGRPSQEGGLTTASTQTSVFGFSSLVPPNLGVHILSVTREGQVNSRAIDVMNTPIGDATTFASGFPAAGPPAVVSPSPEWKGPSRLLVGGIAITTPAPGASVTAGIPLQVTVTPSGGFTPTRVVVVSNHDAAEVESAPFVATVEVPPEALGPLRLKAVAYDAGDVLATAADVQVNVVTPATLTSIRAEPSRHVLFTPPDRRRLNVIGSFSDGVDRDVSAATNGTIYSVSDPLVMSIDADGMMTAAAEGVAVVHVTNGARVADVIVQVKPLPVLLRVSRTDLEWPATANATGYDVVRGDLPILRGTLGSYELAIAECLADNVPEPRLVHSAAPTAGEAWFYLMRAVLSGGPLTYDGYAYGATTQVLSRDAGIALAAGACP